MMQLSFYKPKHAFLKKYIEGYYFILEDANSDPIKYWTFPNNYTIVAITQNVLLTQSNGKMMILPSKEKNIFSNITYRYTAPIEIFYERPLNEITLYFKPLGLNFFIEKVDAFYVNDNASEIEFNPFPDFKIEMKKILNTPNREKQIELLEHYWLTKFENKDFQMMEHLLSDIETDMRIDEIAKKHAISRQYLNKLFQKHIGKSPSEYRKIYRFRKSVIEQEQVLNLTKLSHENLFYDQSHFIKDFKELTHVNPKSFFKNVNTKKDTIWLFI